METGIIKKLGKKILLTSIFHRKTHEAHIINKVDSLMLVFDCLV